MVQALTADGKALFPSTSSSAEPPASSSIPGPAPAPAGSTQSLDAEASCSQHVDAVIYATGYVYSFPFLRKADVVSTDRQYVEPLYR